METLTVFFSVDQKIITLTYPRYAENIGNSVVIAKSYPVCIAEKKLKFRFRYNFFLLNGNAT
jgi:hypothetical protein